MVLLDKAQRKVYRAIHVHGLARTASLLWETLRTRQAPALSAFDQQWGVATDGGEDIGDLVIAERAHYRHAVRYQPTTPEVFAAALAACPIPYEGTTFVDLGSGKGRALLMATAYPFHRIIGVEFAADLVAIARANIRRLGVAVQTMCLDAATYPLPSGPLLVFMFNPFDAVVMAKVIQRLEQSLAAAPRPCAVVYCNPVYAELWDASPRFLRVATGERFAVWGAK